MAFVYSIFHIPYRQLEGFLRKLSDLISRDIAADYTTLFKRIAKMNITLPETISENEKKEELGGYKGWRDKYEYSKRWLAESVLSAVKRIFGETVRATSIDGMFREAKMKFMCYNILLNCV